jgi:hypothetical protein
MFAIFAILAIIKGGGDKLLQPYRATLVIDNGCHSCQRLEFEE